MFQWLIVSVAFTFDLHPSSNRFIFKQSIISYALLPEIHQPLKLLLCSAVAKKHSPSLSTYRWLKSVCVCGQASMKHLDILSRDSLPPAKSTSQLLPTPVLKSAVHPNHRAINIKWLVAEVPTLRSSHGVPADRRATVELPLWLWLSFSQCPAPADGGWKLPTAALKYELDSAPAVYAPTPRHGEPFPAEMPLGANYWGNISCNATWVVMVCRQSTWRSFCLAKRRRGWETTPAEIALFIARRLKGARWFSMSTTSTTLHTGPRPRRLEWPSCS